MKTFGIAFTIMISSILVFGQKSVEIPFKEAKNYFVRNDFKIEKFSNPKIENQSRFDEIFSGAPLMGEEGRPTVIDFSKQFVIAIIQKETNKANTLIINNLTKTKKGTLNLLYQYTQGKEQSYTTVPCVILIVDNKYKSKVVLQRVGEK